MRRPLPALPHLRPLAFGLGLVGLVGLGSVGLGFVGLVEASPPAEPPPVELGAESDTGSGDTSDPEPGFDPLPPVPGVWLSVELIGPRGAQLDAAEALRVDPVVDALPRGGSPPPGELVGRVDTLEQALAWVATQATSPVEGDGISVPGGALLAAHGVHLTALVLTAASSSGGTQPYPWPSADQLPTPPEWVPASLAVARAPVFAAPSPQLPPASERYRTVASTDALWRLAELERCDTAGRCLRWAQILVREGDRWFGGWVPAAHVVADRDWVGGPDERRFALVASQRDRASLGFVLLEQQRERRAPPRGLSHPHAGREWPAATLELVGERMLARVGDAPILSLDMTPAASPVLRPSP